MAKRMKIAIVDASVDGVEDNQGEGEGEKADE